MLKLMMLMVFSGCTSQTSTADELRRLRGRLRKNFSLLSELVIKRPCSPEIILLALKFTTRATWFSFRSVWQQVNFTNTSQMLLQTAPRQSSRHLPDTLHILPRYHLRHPPHFSSSQTQNKRKHQLMCLNWNFWNFKWFQGEIGSHWVCEEARPRLLCLLCLSRSRRKACLHLQVGITTLFVCLFVYLTT